MQLSIHSCCSSFPSDAMSERQKKYIVHFPSRVSSLARTILWAGHATFCSVLFCFVLFFFLEECYHSTLYGGSKENQDMSWFVKKDKNILNCIAIDSCQVR